MKPSSAELEGKTCSVISQIVSKSSCFIKSSIDVMICPMSCPATHTQEILQLVAASCSYWCPRSSWPSATCTGGAFSTPTSPFTYYWTNTLVCFATCTVWLWYVYMCACVRACVCVCVCMCVCVCVCNQLYHSLYIHTYIHSYTLHIKSSMLLLWNILQYKLLTRYCI